MAWLRKQRGARQRALLVSCISFAEVLEGSKDLNDTSAFLQTFVIQNMGMAHARKCAHIQKRAATSGSRFGENDAWQLAFAEISDASIVGKDTKAFTHLGSRYEQY